MHFDLQTKLNELERRKNVRYGYAEISKATGDRISRQTVRYLLNRQVARIDVDTLSALLDFFAAEGMPITVADLFRVDQHAS